MNTRLQAILLVSAALLPSAVHAAPTFERDVLPILNAHCLQCHGGVHQRNGLDLRTLATVQRGGQSGAVIVPGKPDESLLWQKLQADLMPKTDNKVSKANKELIRAWIAAGAAGIERAAPPQVTRAPLPPAEVARRIDAAVGKKLAETKLPASPRADDAEFLRRATLDLAGRIPTAAQAAAFLDDPNPRKREKLIDDLLASPEFGRQYAERWVNVYYLGTVNQSPKNPTEFTDWMAQELNANRGWDAIVRDVLTASGPLADQPQGMFFYYNSDMNGQFTPKILAGNIGQTLLGIQIQCAECHDHPFNDWKQTDFWSLAAFFGQVARMETVENKNTPGVKERHLEIKNGKPQQPPKEISISIPNDGEARNGGKKVLAAALDGQTLALDPTQSHRPPLASWLTAPENRQFALATANRYWAHFFGRGLVNPLNDFGDHNAPSHPELLDTLADELVASGYDLKHLARCIGASEAYQRTSQAAVGNESPVGEALFARMAQKVLTPEQLYDSLCLALELPALAPPPDPKKKPNPKAPPPPSPRAVFCASFRGPGEQDEPLEMKLGVPHSLKLMNDPLFNDGGKLVERLLALEQPAEKTLDEIHLALLARRPNAGERQKLLDFVARQSSPREAYARVVWLLLNGSEFLLNH